ncbi:MAG: dTMP kinase [Pseudonocardiaceae bacterium]
MAGDSTTLLAPEPPLAPRRGALVSVEGLWGSGKTTVAIRLGQRLTDAGFVTTVMHYGPRHGVIGKLSQYLEDSPLRSRSGTGGYARPHHATVDVLLRLCREAYHHTHLYRPALAKHDVVVLDHGVYSKLAYALTVLTEQHPDRAEPELLDQIRVCVAPWFVHPDRAFFLDVPWPLARERAFRRGHGGGCPGSVERLLFLPRYTAAYRQVIAAHPQRACRIHVGARGVESVLAEIEDHLSVLLRTSLGAVDA